MNFEDLKNPELQEKLKSAKTAEEILAIAKEEGYQLSDEELSAVSGGLECSWYCLKVVTCDNVAKPEIW